MAVELLPCPFCGADAAYISAREIDDECFVISCDKCNAEGPYYGGNDSTQPEEARKLWNTRAAPPAAPTEAMIEAGVKRLVELSGKHVVYEHMAREIYEAMITAREA